MNSLDFFAGDDKGQDPAGNNKRIQKQDILEVEAHVVTKDNKKILQLFHRRSDRLWRKTLPDGMGIDITERKKAAEQLQKEKGAFRVYYQQLTGYLLFSLIRRDNTYYGTRIMKPCRDTVTKK
jgi:hypothetical protein